MSHAAAAAGEYRRMMEEKSRAECPTQATDGAAENAPQAWAAGTDASTPNDAGTTPKITADDVYDHFKDCEEEEEEGAWHAPATAKEDEEDEEELELSPLEKEPTAGMLFVHVVELYLQDAPDHMPVQVELRLGDETWTSSAITKRFSAAVDDTVSDVDEAQLKCGQRATFILPHDIPSLQIRLSVLGELRGCASAYLPSLVPHKINDCWYTFEETRKRSKNSIRIALRCRPFPPLQPGHIRRDMFGFVLKGKASPQWGAEAIQGGDAWSPGRGDVWFRLSGALAKCRYHAEECTPPLTFESYLSGPLPEKVRSDIAKDVPRTFPEHAQFAAHPSPLTRSLQRVLEAYARRNPNIGYCQGLNFVCGLLLCVCEEDIAFWLLSSLVEDICPNYHSPNMAGLKIDLEVLQELGDKDLAGIKAHFDEIGGDISLVCLPWLLTVFSDSAPARVTFRFWDMVFEGGSPAVMCLALAMLRELEPQILACDSISEVMDLVHRCDPSMQPNWESVVIQARKRSLSYKEIIIAREHHYSLLRSTGPAGMEADDTMAAIASTSHNFHPVAIKAGAEEQEGDGEASARAAAEAEMDVMSPHTPFGDGTGGTERPGMNSLLSGFTASTRKGWGKPGFWAGVAGMGSAIKVKVNGLSDLTRAEDLGEIFGLLGATSQAKMSDADDHGEGQGTPFTRRRAEVEFGSLEAAQNCVSILDGSLVDGTFISVRLEGDEDGEEEVEGNDTGKGRGSGGVEGGAEGELLDDDWDIPSMGDASVIEEGPPTVRPAASGRKLSARTRFLDDEEEKGRLGEDCEGDAGDLRITGSKGSSFARDMSQTGMWRTCKTAEDDEEGTEEGEQVEGLEGDSVDKQQGYSPRQEDSVVSDASVQLARSLLEAAEELVNAGAISKHSSPALAAPTTSNNSTLSHHQAKLTPESEGWHSPVPITPAIFGTVAPTAHNPENLFFSPKAVSPPTASGQPLAAHAGQHVGSAGQHVSTSEDFIAWETDVARAVSQWLGGGKWEGGAIPNRKFGAECDMDDGSSSGTSCSSEDWRITDWLPPRDDGGGWPVCTDGHAPDGVGRQHIAAAAPSCGRCAQWMETEREMEAESEEWRIEIARATLGALAVAVPMSSHEGGDTANEGGRVGALQRLLSEARGTACTGRRADMSIGIRAVEAMLACNAEVGVQSQVRDALERTLANILGESGTGGHRTGLVDAGRRTSNIGLLEPIKGSSQGGNGQRPVDNAGGDQREQEMQM